ncbi:MAG: HprK-related kinase A [Pseudomonadota bacterium]|nr:HprK-related kinase A [Pseudomonadota bacterium]
MQLNISINCGAYRFRLNDIPPYIVTELKSLYGFNLTVGVNGYHDFSLSVKSTSPVRRYFRKQCIIEVEGVAPFNPISTEHMLPSLEWAMNWSVAAFEHTKLSIHSSVVVKNGKAILFPATSGSGKSTLATFLGANGWQMFSDEMALIDTATCEITPLYRPSSLKNNSIDIIKSLCKNVCLSATAVNTHKGDIAHATLYTPEEFGTFKPTVPAFVVFLRFSPGKVTTIMEMSQAEGFAMLLRNAFNYNILGKTGFETLSSVLNGSTALHVEYSDIHDLNRFLLDLVS